MDSFIARLKSIVADVVVKEALQTDQTAAFPRHSIDALGKAGILGLTTAEEVGGLGFGTKEAASVVELLAEECPSTAMIVCMHYSANAVLEKFAPSAVRQSIAKGKHLSTLAFSEQGSRSHFWAPLGTATESAGKVLLNGKKSWVTSAGEADSYLWSSKPLASSEMSSIWYVPADSPGIHVGPAFNGLGLRGNASTTVAGENVPVTKDQLLGEDGKGFAIMMGDVLPIFSVLAASVSIGLMSSSIRRAAAHISGTSFDHLGQKLVDLPTIRAYLARAQINLDQARALRDDTLASLDAGREDAMLRVLEVKASAAEASLCVTDSAMRICGGAAFRKEAGVERLFRDARAASVMAPTSDVLYDFIGKAVSGLPLF